MAKVIGIHVGSLPRSQDVLDVIFAGENEQSFDCIRSEY
jgi:hypothetical protein